MNNMTEIFNSLFGGLILPDELKAILIVFLFEYIISVVTGMFNAIVRMRK